MKCFVWRSLFVWAFICPVLLWAKKTGAPDVFDRIMANIREVQLQDVPETVLNGKAVNALLSSLTPEGMWPDIDYKSRRQTAWEPAAHLLRLHTLALAYTDPGAVMYANDRVYAAVVNGLECWYDEDPRSSNWWNQQIFCPKQIGEILILLRAGKHPLPASLENKLLQRMAQIGGTPDGEYSAGSSNRINISAHWIYRGCLTRDKAVLERGISNYMLPLRFCLPGTGLQKDYSFQEHGRQLYIGNYGYAFVDNVSEGALFLRGTPYALSGEQLGLFSHFVSHTYINALRGKYYSFAIPGRQVANRNALDKSKTTEILDRMCLIDPSNYKLYQAAKDRWSGVQGPSFKVAPLHNHFRLSDYTTHIRPEYYFDVRFVSSRTVRTENVNNENKKGFFLADGATNITISGNEYFNVFAVWDWCKVPGVTAPLLDTLPDMKNKSGGTPGSTSFAGGVSDSLNGASTYTMYYPAFGTRAKKSWFCFDKEIVCLGAGIQSASNADVATTVNQCLSNGKVFWKEGDQVTGRADLFGEIKAGKHLNWVLHNGFGYLFPGGQSVHLSNRKQSGNWFTISDSQKDEQVAEKVFTLWLDHGKKPEGGTYAYLIVPNMVKPEQMEQYEKKAAVQIRANNDSLQVVCNAVSGITQAVLFAKGQVIELDAMLSLRCNDPAIVMVKKVEAGWMLHLADPSQLLKATAVSVINRQTAATVRTLSIALPQGDAAGSTVSRLIVP